MDHLLELLTDPAHLVFELIMSLVIDLFILGMLMPLIVKIVKHYVNKDRDRRHGHENDAR